MTKKFLTSVADAYAYGDSGELLFVAKTLLDSSVEMTLQSSDVRGGKGNKKLFTYYHSADMNLTITDAQWNLDFLATTLGEDVTTGKNVYTQETVTLGSGGVGTVVGTPLAVEGTTIYGWVTHAGVDSPETVTFTGQEFTSSVGAEDDDVCVRYYALDSAARSLAIKSNIIPKIVRLVLEAQLNSSDESTNKIGTVQIEVPKAQLSGNFSISMTSDGVASTPLNAMALDYSEDIGGCSGGEGIYANITEILDSANWYDNVIGLSIVGGDFSMTSGTQQLTVKAIPMSGAAFTPPVADLTFASDTPATATVSAGGLVTYVGAGTTTVKASITAKTDIDANVVVTCS